MNNKEANMMEQEKDRGRCEEERGQETNLNAEQILGLSIGSQPDTNANKDDVPTLWKIFGGAIVSIIFMLIVTIFGYIINNMTNVQNSINGLNADMVKKAEFNDRITTMWGTLRQVDILKDRLATVEQRCPAIDSLKERATAIDQKTIALENQVKTLQEESRTLQREVQVLRERMAVLEAKK